MSLCTCGGGLSKKTLLTSRFWRDDIPISLGVLVVGELMKRKLFIISGGQSGKRDKNVSKPRNKQRAEPNLQILKESPCLRCDLYIEDTRCSYVPGCSKIDEFQRVASVHCTLYKPHDVSSIAKI